MNKNMWLYPFVLAYTRQYHISLKTGWLIVKYYGVETFVTTVDLF
jgi:hypothetical protein